MNPNMGYTYALQLYNAVNSHHSFTLYLDNFKQMFCLLVLDL